MVDVSELYKNDFWRKKFRRAVVARDVDKDGFITRGDFDLVTERYRKIAGKTPTKVDQLSESFSRYCDALGLVDESVQLSYEDFEERWKVMLANDMFQSNMKNMFTCLDANDDGTISLDEWIIHNAAIDISAEHAKESFRAMDTDGDGKISMDEFVDFHVEYFQTAENKLNSAILFGPL